MRLNYLEQLFPGAFNDTKICEYLLSDLRKWLEQAIVAYKQHSQGNNKSVGQQQLAVAAEILKLYCQIQITVPVNQLVSAISSYLSSVKLITNRQFVFFLSDRHALQIGSSY